MEKSSTSNMEFQLRKLFIRYFDIFAYHQWPSESARWTELLFALTTRISKKSEAELREIIEELDDLELLDPKPLAALPVKNGAVNLDHPHAKHIFEVLSEYGFSKEEAKKTILTMHEAAKSLEKHHGGKIQRYLRKYGRKMIDEISDNFSFSQMDNADIKYAFTYWLQNTLNMPLSLGDEAVKKFLKKFNKKPEDLVQTVDELDINLAIVDDLIFNEMSGKNKRGE